LSSVLRTRQAIQINISFMRTFTKIKKFISQNQPLARKIQKLQKNTRQLFSIVFHRLESLETLPPALPSKKKKIGLT
ncbi:MAG: ORF6N domain-containing protein, partial [Pseudomonadota bacterium]